MERYIDADNFRKTMIKRFGCIPCLTDYSEASRYDIPIDDALNLAPTADVVPKSEYDAVVSAVDNSTREFLKLHDTYQEQNAEIERLNQILDSYALQYGTVTVKQAVMDKAKAEVAREIFAEIEERLLPSNTSGEYRGDSIEWFDYYDLHLAEDIAELKKKYTEGE